MKFSSRARVSGDSICRVPASLGSRRPEDAPSAGIDRIAGAPRSLASPALDHGVGGRRRVWFRASRAADLINGHWPHHERRPWPSWPGKGHCRGACRSLTATVMIDTICQTGTSRRLVRIERPKKTTRPLPRGISHDQSSQWQRLAIPMSRATLGGEQGAGMNQLDDILLRELGRGPGTVQQLALRLQKRVRHSLTKLCVRGHAVREGRGGPHRQHVYRISDSADRS
jgi:hypothetical protein